ncbi:MAG TPA: efflux RND transporter periplasmic adaptor subunit [Polyangiales bacterium]|nr:efflux RND transporter periplasmic adaptor subunit [Polyangiales bacterium]
MGPLGLDVRVAQRSFLRAALDAAPLGHYSPRPRGVVSVTIYETGLSQLAARAFACSLSVFAACAAVDAEPAHKPEQTPTNEVTVEVIKVESIALQTELAGRTSAYHVAEVRPQVTGIIQAREFREGSQVTAGQLLYRIDPAVYRAAVERSQAELESAEARVLTAKVRAERYAELVKINAVSKQEKDDALAGHMQAVAAVAQARASLKSARINLDFTHVVAPISGRIGRSNVTQGALVTASQSAPLATIAQLDPMFVDVTQSSVQLLHLKRLLSSGGALPASASVRLRLEDGTDYPVLGELQFTDVTVDPSSGSVTLRALFPNPDALLLPGMYVRAIMDEALEPHGILAPQQAIARDERGQAQALVVDANSKVQLRTLTTGRAIGDRWHVTQGLQAGDRVIVEGNHKVKPGDVVKPVVRERVQEG